jgi:hypothetical protein
MVKAFFILQLLDKSLWNDDELKIKGVDFGLGRDALDVKQRIGTLVAGILIPERIIVANLVPANPAS